MKKLLLLMLTAVTISTAVHAQITKGTVLVGVNAHYYSQETFGYSVTKTKAYHFTPSVGYTFKNNNVAGLSLGYGRTTMEPNHGKEPTNTYSAGLFYRRYFKLAKGLYLFGEANAGYSFSHTVQALSTDTKVKSRQHEVSMGIYPGLSYQLHKRFYVEAAWHNLPRINYTSNIHKFISPTDTYEDQNKEFSFSTSRNRLYNYSVGFRFVLGK